MTRVNVLWVDDEPDPVRADVLAEMEREVDEYRFNLAHTATTPEEAREYFFADPSQVDLIVMDLLWDGEVLGIRLIHDLLQDHDLPVVYLTGYFSIAGEKLEGDLKGRPPWVHLTKDFQPGELPLAMARAKATFDRVNRSVIINQALTVLRKHLDWGEDFGRSQMRELSHKTGERLVAIAERIRVQGRAIEASQEMRDLKSTFDPIRS